MADRRTAIQSMERATATLDAAGADARPGLQRFSNSTVPEADALVRDMRSLTDSLTDLSNRLNEDGIGGALGPRKLPDYEPGN
ncbi:MAG: hypothetical protein EX258_02160 [Sphingomonadaceae bacterium]|nr:MAG: hypothetical protein EX258_02160 [Sphingomonadaceae bacterium]